MPLSPTWVSSPNRSKGLQGYRPDAIVVHLMEGTLRGTDSWFRSPQSSVSAHYGIGTDGAIHQYVGESDTAWHAGRVYKSTWRRRKPRVNPNLYTIGIEHEGYADSEWPDAMYRGSAALIRDICNRWSIPLDRDHIVGHREISVHKTCPGDRVDLAKLIGMAKEEATTAAVYNFMPDAGTVKTRTDLNLRKGAPTTAVPVAKTVRAGKELTHVGWTSNGLAVNGNAHWYKDADGDYFWAGGTDKPIPGL